MRRSDVAIFLLILKDFGKELAIIAIYSGLHANPVRRLFVGQQPCEFVPCPGTHVLQYCGPILVVW